MKKLVLVAAVLACAFAAGSISTVCSWAYSTSAALAARSSSPSSTSDSDRGDVA